MPFGYDGLEDYRQQKKLERGGELTGRKIQFPRFIQDLRLRISEVNTNGREHNKVWMGRVAGLQKTLEYITNMNKNSPQSIAAIDDAIRSLNATLDNMDRYYAVDEKQSSNATPTTNAAFPGSLCGSCAVRHGWRW